MHTRFVVGVGLIILLGFFGLFAHLLLTTQPPQSSAPSTKTPVVPGVRVESGEWRGWYRYEEKKPTYELEVYYPPQESGSDTELDTQAQRQLEAYIKRAVSWFSQEVVAHIDEQEATRISQNGAPYIFSIKPRLLVQTQRYRSYVFDEYLYSGGAHGNPATKTFVFDANGTPVVLADLFTPGVGYLERLAALVKPKLIAQMQEKIGVDAQSAQASLNPTGFAPKAENYKRFYITRDSLVILFDPYDVAAYAAGSFTVSIPLSELRDLLRS